MGVANEKDHKQYEEKLSETEVFKKKTSIYIHFINNSIYYFLIAESSVRP